MNERGPPRLSWDIDEEAVAEAAKLDGKAKFETRRAAEILSPAAGARAYRDRDTVKRLLSRSRILTGYDRLTSTPNNMCEHVCSSGY